MKKNKCDDCCIGLRSIPFENLVEVFETDYYSFDSYYKDGCFLYNYCPHCRS